MWDAIVKDRVEQAKSKLRHQQLAQSPAVKQPGWVVRPEVRKEFTTREVPESEVTPGNPWNGYPETMEKAVLPVQTCFPRQPLGYGSPLRR